MSHTYAPLSVDMQNCPPAPITATSKKRTASRSSTPGPRTRGLAIQTGDKTPKHGLPSPPTSASTEPPSPPPSASIAIPPSPTEATVMQTSQIFWNDWVHAVGPTHPNFKDGIDIFRSLVGRPIVPSNRYSYLGRADPRRPVPLDRLSQIDLHALEYDRHILVTDQRVPHPHPPPELTDGHALRTALFSGEPIAFTLPSARDGVRTAKLDVPGYMTLAHQKTLFAGVGTFCFLASSATRDHETVLTQTAGKCVLVHFPMTPENRPTAREYALAKGQHVTRFRWALNQPGACIRFLLPGEHVFLPQYQACAMLCLGHNGCPYSATALSDVALAPRSPAMDVDSNGESTAEPSTPSRHRPAASWG